ncbi:unnamed protein product, partial [marine sediment metagenome]
ENSKQIENGRQIGVSSIDGIKVTYFRRYFPYTLFFAPSLIPYIRKNISKFDVIHMQDFRTFLNVVAYFYAKKFGIPYVLSAHGSVLRSGYFPKQLKKWIFDIILGYKMLRNASRLIALSELEVKEYQSFGISKNMITIIPNAIDPEGVSNSLNPGYFKEKYKIKETFLISFVGRIHKIKGLDFPAILYFYFFVG